MGPPFTVSIIPVPAAVFETVARKHFPFAAGFDRMMWPALVLVLVVVLVLGRSERSFEDEIEDEDD